MKYRPAMLLLLSLFATGVTQAADPVKLGLNYPVTGPYRVQGQDQLRAAQLAVDEINAAGGILGRPVELVCRDTKSKPGLARDNAVGLIEDEGCRMLFGGASSGVAVAVGEVCQQKGVPFFGTLTYSTVTTGVKAHRHTFRECYDAWMAAGVLADYLQENFAGKKYTYLTADYTWGWTTEASLRRFTGTQNSDFHKGLLTPLGTRDFGKQLSLVQMIEPEVLVLVLFGDDLVNAIRQATAMGLKRQCQIVVPSITLGMAAGAGPKAMAGVIGALPWCWQVPFEYGYLRGQQFVLDFAERYNRYPSSSGASAYTIVHEYAAACERAGGFEAPEVIAALEGHSYTFLKDPQTWRAWDHQSVQTVYAVRCKAREEVLDDRFRMDYFEIIGRMAGDKAAITRAEWEAVREANGLPTQLEPLNTMAAQ